MLLSALTADSQHLSALSSGSLSPTANHQTARKRDKEGRKTSTSQRKSSGHQRTSHSQNSSITLARLVCLVSLVFSPYDNTVFGKQTAGTALTSCSSIFHNNGSTDITLNLFSAPSPALKSLWLLRGSKSNVFLSVICPVREGKNILLTYCRHSIHHVYSSTLVTLETLSYLFQMLLDCRND